MSLKDTSTEVEQEKSQEEISIKVEALSKVFKLPHERVTTIKSAFIHFRKLNRNFELQKALEDISFEVKKGEFFGVVGRNGSGKSTLLKLLAGIYTPTKGSVTINGTLTPFIELGVGFNSELTGRENVFLNGALLGFRRKEMQAMYDDIVGFAELENFMDQKLKNYSSGMQVRLAFSIAIRARSDILLVDEVLAVGDERFQNKCLGVFEEIKNSGRTVVFISHDMGAIRRFCDRTIVIDNGKMVFEGDSSQAAAEYARLNLPEESTQTEELPASKVKVQIKKVNNAKQDKASILNYGDIATVVIKWVEDKRVKNVGIALYTEAGVCIFGSNTKLDNKNVESNYAEFDIELKVTAGNYYLQVELLGANDSQKIYTVEKAISFRVLNSGNWQGVVYLNHEWRTN